MSLSPIYIGLTIAGCVIFSIIIIIVCCCCKKRTEAQKHENFLKSTHETTQMNQSIHAIDSEMNVINTNGVTHKTSIEIITDDNNKSEPEQIIENNNNNNNNNNINDNNNNNNIVIETQTDQKQKDTSIRKLTNENITKNNENNNNMPNKPKERQSMRIKLTSIDGQHTMLNPSPSNASPNINNRNHVHTGTTIINPSPSNSNQAMHELKSQWNLPANTAIRARPESTLDQPLPRNSVKLKHAETESFDADNFDIDRQDANHGYGASVQIHEVTQSQQDMSMTSAMILTPDALPVETIPSHYLSDSVESLDPDFVLEPAYFENAEVYSMSRESSYNSNYNDAYDAYDDDEDTIEYKGKEHVHAANNTLTVAFQNKNNQNSVTSQSSQHTQVESMRVSSDMNFGSTQWSMPGVSIDHTASIQMLQSMQMFGAKRIANNNKNNTQYKPVLKNNNNNQNNNIGKSVQYQAIPNVNNKNNNINNNIGKSVQYQAMPNINNNNNNNNIGKSIQYEAMPNTNDAEYGPDIGKSVQYKPTPKNIGKSIQYNSVENKSAIDSKDIGKSVQMAAAQSMGGEQFIMWQMHGRKLKKMSHESLIKWLSAAGFDSETLNHFRKYQIDGHKLWQNIRNASMFLYNVGVVRPTLRDAIVQNIYLELLPKTPGFDERHMTDFKNLKLIASGPISTVYKANIQKEKLKLRESIVIIKGYHFAADDVRVGKIIQILVHMVTNINSSRFVKIHGFIRNMMENNTNTNNNTMQRPMFGIVMEYCDGGSIHSMFKNGIADRKRYHLEYNIMDKIGILIEIATAMRELHKKNILHRNLKCSNVLMSNNDDIKLTDYCLDVTQLTDFTHSLDAKERSIRWMSPELIKTQNYTKLCDMYSFGITAYEIVSGNKPYHKYSHANRDLLRKIISENLRPDIDDLANLPEELLLLMCKCWSEDINERPHDFDEIIDELDAIADNLRSKCVTFDDIYARQRISMMYSKKQKEFQSSPLLTIQQDNSDDDEYEYDMQEQLQKQLQLQEQYDDNSDDDIKFEQLLAPYNETNRPRPTHVKDDTALELDKIKKFTPKRRKLHVDKKRPRKPLPKAPPVNKELPNLKNDVVFVNDKKIQMPDKPLPPNQLPQ